MNSREIISDINYVKPPSKQLTIPSWNKLATYSSVQLLSILESFGVSTEPYKTLNSSVLACFIWCRTLIELPEASYDGVNVPYPCNSVEELLNWSRLGYRCQVENLSLEIYKELLGSQYQLRDKLNTGRMVIILGNLTYLPLRVSNEVYLIIRKMSLDDLYSALYLLLIGSSYQQYLPLYHFEDLIFTLTTGYILNKEDILTSERYHLISALSPEKQQTLVNLYSSIEGYKYPLSGVIQISRLHVNESVILSDKPTETKLEQLELVASPRGVVSKERYLEDSVGQAPVSPRRSVITIDQLQKMSDNARMHELNLMTDLQILDLFGVDLVYNYRNELLDTIILGFNKPIIYWLPAYTKNCRSPGLPIPNGYTGHYVAYGYWTQYYCFPTQPLLDHLATGSKQVPGAQGLLFTDEQISYIKQYSLIVGGSNSTSSSNVASSSTNSSNVASSSTNSSNVASSSTNSSNLASSLTNSSNVGSSNIGSNKIEAGPSSFNLLKTDQVKSILQLLYSMGRYADGWNNVSTERISTPQAINSMTKTLNDINQSKNYLSTEQLQFLLGLNLKPDKFRGQTNDWQLNNLLSQVPSNPQPYAELYLNTAQYYLKAIFNS